MSLAGSRRITHEGREYDWLLRRRGNEIRVVAQDATTCGQLLVARYPVYVQCLRNESHGEYFKQTPNLTPQDVRQIFAEALRQGWRPQEKVRRPFQMGTASGWFRDSADYQLIDDLWMLLHAICQDPAWRERLMRNPGAFVPVTEVDIHTVEPGLVACLEKIGDLVVHVRDSDHGDGEPHLAIRSVRCRRDLVLEDITEWYRGR